MGDSSQPAFYTSVPLILASRSSPASELLSYTNVLPGPLGAHGIADGNFGSYCCCFWLGSHRTIEKGASLWQPSPHLTSCHPKTHWRYILKCFKVPAPYTGLCQQSGLQSNQKHRVAGATDPCCPLSSGVLAPDSNPVSFRRVTVSVNLRFLSNPGKPCN